MDKILRLLQIRRRLSKATLDQSQNIKRDAFIYLEPNQKSYRPDRYAQCNTCFMWSDPAQNICHIHGKNIEVTADMTCTIYVNGKPMPEMGKTAKPFVTPEESGLATYVPRCENCRYANKKKLVCYLFKILNETLPDYFDLDTNIKPLGCCNAQMPLEE